MGMREKPQNTKTNTKTKEKNCPFVWPPHPRLPNGGRLFFGARKTPKTCQTYPKLERIPILMGKRKTGLGVVWAVNTRKYDFYTHEIRRSLTKAGWSKAWGTKTIRMEKILVTNNYLTDNDPQHTANLVPKREKLFPSYPGWVPERPVPKIPWAGRGGKNDSNVAPFLPTRFAAFTHLLSNVMWSKRFLSHLILTLSECLKYKTRSRGEKFASSYNPFFCVAQITILAIARIVRNTTSFSPLNGGETLSTT